MAELDLVIARRPLTVRVDDGDEARIEALAHDLSAFISDLRAQARDASDSQILMLAALSLMDEREKARSEAKLMQQKYEHKANDMELMEQKMIHDDAQIAGLLDQLTAIVAGLVAPSSAPPSSALPSSAPSDAASDNSGAVVTPKAEPNSSGAAEPNVSGAAEPASSGAAKPNVSGAAEPTSSGVAEPTSSGAAEPTSSGAAEPTSSGAAEPTSPPDADKMPH